jgi:membrane protease YdiL (CAAX protease family)
MSTFSLPRRIWRAVYPTLLYIGTHYFALFCIMIAYAVYIGPSLGEAVDANTVSAAVKRFLSENPLLILLLGTAVAFVIFLAMWRKTRYNYKRFLGGKFSVVTAALAVLLTAACGLLLTSLLGLTGANRTFLEYGDVSELISGENVWMRLLALAAFVLIAPAAEELCFRGITFNRIAGGRKQKLTEAERLRERMRRAVGTRLTESETFEGARAADAEPITAKWLWIAIGLQALLFSVAYGVAHMNVLQGVYALLFGVLMGVLYSRFRSILYPLLGHIVFNLVGVLTGDLFVNSNGLALPLFIVSIVVAAGSLFLLIKLSAKQAAAVTAK